MPEEYSPDAPDRQDKTGPAAVSVSVEDKITICRPPEVRFARKRVHLSADGSRAGVVQVDQKNKWVDFATRPVPDLDALFRVLTEEAARGDSYVVLGEPIRLGGPQRRLTKPDGNDPATLNKVPRRWIAVDIDKLPPPAGVAARTITPEEVVDYIAGLTPPEFAGASCIVQWSSSATLSDTINVRLWYRLSRGLADDERRAWFRGSPKVVDRAIFGSHQPIFIANPEFVGGPDPLDGRRWVRLRGEVEEVPVPSVIAPPSVDEAENFAKRVALVEGRNWIEKLDTAGEQKDGGPGFHAPCISAAGAFVAENGPDADPAEFLAAVAAMLKERCRRGASYVAERIADTRRAVVTFQANDRAKETPRVDARERVIWDTPAADFAAVLDPVLAEFAAGAGAWLAAAQAQARRAALVAAAAEETASLAPRLMFDTEAEIAAAEAEDARRKASGSFVVDDPVSMKFLLENRERAEAALVARLPAAVPVGPRPQVALAVPVGIGKTAAAETMIAGLVAGGLRVAFHAADHGLARELRDRLAARGVNAVVWHGLSADDPDRPSATMCARSAEAEELRHYGGKAEDLCGSAKRGLCRFHEEATGGVAGCGYRTQWAAARQADVVVFAGNAALAMAPRRALRRSPAKVTVPFGRGSLTANVRRPAFDVMVVDEPVLLQLVEGTEEQPPQSIAVADIEFGELFDPTLAGGDEKARARIEAAKAAGIEGRLRAFIAGFAAGGGLATYGAMRTAGWATRDAALADRRLVYGAKIALKVPGDEELEDFAKRPGMAAVLGQNARLEQIAAVLEAVADALAAQPAVVDAEETPFLRLASSAAGGRRLLVSRVRPIHDGWHIPTMILDATPREVVLRKWFPDVSVKLDWMIAELPGAVRVRQLCDRDLSAAVLKGWITAGRAGNFAKLAGYIEARHARFGSPGGTLVITSKVVEAALLDHWHGKLPAGVELAHFGAIRGRDRWRDVSLLIEIGRNLPDVRDLQKLAGLLEGRVLPPTDYRFETPHWLVRQGDGSVRRVDGGYRGVACHADPVVEALRAAACDDESRQAVGRGRLYRRGPARPLQVDRLTLVSGGPHTPVDELVRLDAVLDEGDLLPEELLACRGVRIDTSKKGGSGLAAFLLGVSPNAIKMQTRNSTDRRAVRAEAATQQETQNQASDAGATAARGVSLTVSKPLYMLPIHRGLDTVSAQPPTSPEDPPPMQPTTRIWGRKRGSRYYTAIEVEAKDRPTSEAVLRGVAELGGADPTELEFEPDPTGATPRPARGPAEAKDRRKAPPARPSAPLAGEKPPPVPEATQTEKRTGGLLTGLPDRADARPDLPPLSVGELAPAAASAPPVPELAPAASEALIQLTLDDITALGRDLGLALPTIRKINDRLRPVERLSGIDAAVRSGIDAVVGEAVRRGTASPDGVRLLVGRLAVRLAVGARPAGA